MCTGIRLIANDNAVITARTLEFAQDLQSRLIIVPRNYNYRGTTFENKSDGFPWQVRYAFVGMNAYDFEQVVDGLNEQGLAGGLFYFPDYASYQTVEVADYNKMIAPWELLTLILSSCATIAEVRELLSRIKVGNVPFPAWGFVPPVHAIVHDPTGKSLVIEYVGGKLMLHDNPLGVITNAPTFDWHMTNLRNYTGLSAFNAPERNLDTLPLKPFGQGSGMFGIPGDFTSPSRFIRAVAFSHGARNSANAATATADAFHILNNFDIPPGSVCEAAQQEISCESTQWSSLSDLTNRRYYVRTHGYALPQFVELSALNFDTTTVRMIKLKEAPFYETVSETSLP